MNDIEREPLLPHLLLTILPDIAIPTHPPRGLMAIHDLRKDSHALHVRIMLAPVPDADIDGRELRLHALMAQQLPRATVGERVGVQAQCALGAKDEAGAVVVALGCHVRTAFGHVEAAIYGGDGRVVGDDEAAVFVGQHGDAAVAEEEDVPVVAVGRVWG